MGDDARMAIIEIDSVGSPPAIEFPSLLLINPKFSANVAKVYRLAACFGITQVWHTGDRIGPDMGRGRRTRLPPEERMRGFGKVDLIRFDAALEGFAEAGARIVGVELTQATQSLLDLEHALPAEEPGMVYVFGPEDDRLRPEQSDRCHTVVQIPAFHCLNLATAVSAVLWDRTYKLWRDHGVAPPELVGG